MICLLSADSGLHVWCGLRPVLYRARFLFRCAFPLCSACCPLTQAGYTRLVLATRTSRTGFSFLVAVCPVCYSLSFCLDLPCTCYRMLCLSILLPDCQPLSDVLKPLRQLRVFPPVWCHGFPSDAHPCRRARPSLAHYLRARARGLRAGPCLPGCAVRLLRVGRLP